MLEHGNFHIGMEFWTEAGRWRCTDVGARTICAIKLEGDPRDWDGPPYMVVESVFDENDFGALYATEHEVPETVRCTLRLGKRDKTHYSIRPSKS